MTKTNAGIVSFYEKSGCKGNAKQKKVLRDHGYKVQAIDMLNKKWDAKTLCSFIGEKKLSQYVNPKAPQVMRGGWSPEKFSDEEILSAMLADPILIKRPLIFYRGEFGCGFDSPLAKKLLGEEAHEMECHNGKHECMRH